jgi:hypothetical protein
VKLSRTQGINKNIAINQQSIFQSFGERQMKKKKIKQNQQTNKPTNQLSMAAIHPSIHSLTHQWLQSSNTTDS